MLGGLNTPHVEPIDAAVAVGIQATTIVIQVVPRRTIIRSTGPPEPARRLIVQRTIVVIPAQDWGKAWYISATTW